MRNTYVGYFILKLYPIWAKLIATVIWLPNLFCTSSCPNILTLFLVSLISSIHWSYLESISHKIKNKHISEFMVFILSKIFIKSHYQIFHFSRHCSYFLPYKLLRILRKFYIIVKASLNQISYKTIILLKIQQLLTFNPYYTFLGLKLTNHCNYILLYLLINKYTNFTFSTSVKDNSSLLTLPYFTNNINF